MDTRSKPQIQFPSWLTGSLLAIVIHTILSALSSVIYYRLFDTTGGCNTESAQQLAHINCYPKYVYSILIAFQIGPSYPLPYFTSNLLIYHSTSGMPVGFMADYNSSIFLLFSALIYGVIGALLFHRFRPRIATLLLILIMAIFTSTITWFNLFHYESF
jgi:membrane associated rhomboid family serine protease